MPRSPRWRSRRTGCVLRLKNWECLVSPCFLLRESRFRAVIFFGKSHPHTAQSEKMWQSTATFGNEETLRI